MKAFARWATTQGDTMPSMTAQISDTSGPIDLTNVETISVALRPIIDPDSLETPPPAATATARVIDAAQGLVAVDPDPSWPSWRYSVHLTIHWFDGARLTVPHNARGIDLTVGAPA